jgi:hypothetical protein
LMEAYRSWWRTNYGTTPNSQATIVAAAWARDALLMFKAGLDVPTAEPIK